MLTNTGRKRILTRVMEGSVGALPIARVVLLKDLPAGDPTAFEWADVTEADFDGYARVDWTPSGVVGIDVEGQGRFQSANHTFTRASTGAAQTIKAMALVYEEGGGDALLDVQRFSPALVLEFAAEAIVRKFDFYDQDFQPVV